MDPREELRLRKEALAEAEQVPSGELQMSPQEELRLRKEALGESSSSTEGSLGRYAGMALRSAASIPGQIADIPLLAYNLPRAVYEAYNPEAPNRTFSLGEMTKQGIDKLTEGKYAPHTNTEKNIAAAGEALAPFGVAGKITKLPKLIQKAYAPTAANIAGTGAGAATAQQVLNINPEDSLSALGLGIVSGSLANRATRGIQGAGRTLMGKAGQDSRARAAIRYKPIGQKLISEIPEELGGKEIESVTHQKAGKLAYKGIDQYKNKADRVFNTLEKKLDSLIGKKIDKESPERFVSMKEPMEWAMDQYNKIETPVMKEEFLNSPLGKQLQKIGFKDLLEADPHSAIGSGITDIKVPYKDLLTFRRNLDNSISTFGQIGSIDQGDLKQLRGQIKEQLGNKIKEFGEKPYKILQRYNQHYEKYADKRIPMINDIKEEKNFPAKAYKKSISDIQDDAQRPEVIIKSLKGPEKEEYTLSLFRDLGKKKGEIKPTGGSQDLPIQKFDLPTFFDNFTSLEPETQKIYMSGLTKPMQQNIKKQLKLYEGYKNIINESEGFADVLFKKPALSLKSKLTKTFIRKMAGEKWESEAGQKKLRTVLEGGTLKKKPSMGSLKQAAVTVTPWMLDKQIAERKKRKYVIHPDAIETR
jgi:hypothetical protein